MYIGLKGNDFGVIYPEIPKANNKELYKLKENNYFDTVVATNNVNSYITKGDIYDIKFGIVYKRPSNWFYRTDKDIPYQFESLFDLNKAFPRVHFVSIANRTLKENCRVKIKGHDYPVKVTQINEDTIDCFDDYNDDRMREPKTNIIKICKPFTGKVFDCYSNTIRNYYNGYEDYCTTSYFLTEEELNYHKDLYPRFIKVVD